MEVDLSHDGKLNCVMAVSDAKESPNLILDQTTVPSQQ